MLPYLLRVLNCSIVVYSNRSVYCCLQATTYFYNLSAQK